MKREQAVLKTEYQQEVGGHEKPSSDFKFGGYHSMENSKDCLFSKLNVYCKAVIGHLS